MLFFHRRVERLRLRRMINNRQTCSSSQIEICGSSVLLIETASPRRFSIARIHSKKEFNLRHFSDLQEDDFLFWWNNGRQKSCFCFQADVFLILMFEKLVKSQKSWPIKFSHRRETHPYRPSGLTCHVLSNIFHTSSSCQ